MKENLQYLVPGEEAMVASDHNQKDWEPGGDRGEEEQVSPKSCRSSQKRGLLARMRWVCLSYVEHILCFPVDLVFPLQPPTHPLCVLKTSRMRKAFVKYTCSGLYKGNCFGGIGSSGGASRCFLDSWL